jgi:hypothetical protein
MLNPTPHSLMIKTLRTFINHRAVVVFLRKCRSCATAMINIRACSSFNHRKAPAGSILIATSHRPPWRHFSVVAHSLIGFE